MRRSIRAALLCAAIFLVLCPNAAWAKTYPTTTSSEIPSGWSDSDVTVTLFVDAVDVAGQISTHYRLNASVYDYTGPITVSSEGANSLTYWSTTTDCATHEQPLEATIRIDKGPPVTTISGLPAGSVASGLYSFALEAADSGIGVAATYYRVGAGPAVLYPGGSVAVPVTSSTSIEYWSVDGLGKSEQAHTATIVVDDTRPMTTISGVPAGWASGAVTFALSARSPYSTVAATYYGLGGGGTLPYGGPVTVSTEGATAVTFHSVDALGAVEPERSTVIRIDRTAPVSTMSGASAGWTHGVSLAISAVDGLSGVSQVACRVGAGNEFTYASPISVRTEGETVVQWRALDRAGNSEEPRSVTVRVDNTGPSCSVQGIPEGVSTGPVTFTLSATDALSGVASIKYSLGTGQPVDYTGPVTVSTPGATTLTYWAVDQASNTSSGGSATIRISTGGAPVTTASGVPAGWSRQDVTLSLSSYSPAGVPVSGTYVRVLPASLFSSYAAPVALTAEGTTTVEYYSVDSLGTREPTKSVYARIDRTPPATTSDAAASYSGTATVRLQATDALSGVAHTWHIVDGGAVREGASAVIASSGTHRIAYWSGDAAGNVETSRTAQFTVTMPVPPDTGDRTAPHTTSDVAVSYDQTATIRFTATDETGGSGVAHTYHILDGQPAAEGSPLVVTVPGRHTLSYWSVDAAGNVESAHSTVFTVTVPMPPIEPPAKQATTITITASANRVLLGRSFILSGRALPSPGLVGRLMHVNVKKPGKTYWSYSSARVMYANLGVSWWYRYQLLRTMRPGTYLFKAYYDGDATYLPSSSAVISISVR